MDEGLIKKYDALVSNLEEPIREIVPAIWRLPFVVDTGMSCSGHILCNGGYGKRRSEGGPNWYPHRATLTIAYSDEPEMADVRERFRKDLKAVYVGSGISVLSFDYVWDKVYGAGNDLRTPGVWEECSAAFPERVSESDENVALVEGLLVEFWEKVADVIRNYDRRAQIGPISGRSFRKVRDWADWKGTFLKNVGGVWRFPEPVSGSMGFG